MKRLFGSILLMLIVLAAVGCTPTAPAVETPATTEVAVAPAEPLELTLEELKVYDGKEGRPAYVAVDGIIYDVSDSTKWKNGDHNGFEAGNDLSDAIANVSPHGKKMLERLTAVGKIVE